MKDANEIRNWILAWLERELRVPAREIKSDENLLNYGMDSVNAIMLVGDLESQLGLRLPPTLLWDYPTVNSLADVVTSDEVAVSNSVPPNMRTETAKEATTSVSQREAEELLQNIDQLSEEQVNELLDRLARE